MRVNKIARTTCDFKMEEINYINSYTTLGQIGVWHVEWRKENEEKYSRQNESKRNF